MTLDQVRRRIRAEHARMGFEGRLALTLEDSAGRDGAYITHWVRPDGAAFEECVAVGHGTVSACLDGLRRYADAYRRRPTVEEVGRTLGLPPSVPAHFRVAAE